MEKSTYVRMTIGNSYPSEVFRVDFEYREMLKINLDNIV